MTDEVIQEEAAPVADGDLDTAQVETTEEATTSDGETDAQADDDAPAKPKGVQKRIGELTANWRSAERERDRLLTLLEQQSAPKSQPEQAKPEPPQTPPTLESVGYDEAQYQAKMAEWVQGNIEQQFSAREKAAQEVKQQESVQAQQKAFAEKAESFAEAHPDYHEIAINPDLPISQAVADVLVASDKGPEVLYHLGQNPGEAERISSLPPHIAALEIGRLEARLSMPQPKKTTSAPPPINPIGGSGSTVADEDSMSTSEWMAMRNKQVHGAN